MNQRILALIVILAIVLGGGFYAYRRLVPSGNEAGGPIYATEPVIRGDLTVSVDAGGTLDPAEGGAIQAPGGYGPNGPIPGPSSYVVKEVLVKEGDLVAPGQVMVRLGTEEMQEQINAKRLKYEADRLALSRMLGVSPDKLDTVDPGHGITLRAPLDGRVVGLSVREGQELRQGQIVARVVNDSRFQLLAKLVPLEAGQLSTGARIVLKFPQFDGLTEAVVSDINPDPVPEDSSLLNDLLAPAFEGAATQGYQFVYYVTIEGKNAGLIRPGMMAQVGAPTMIPGPTRGGMPSTVEAVNFFRYLGRVESYVSEEQILSGADAIATKVWVREMQRVKAGDPLVSLAGADARETLVSLLEQVRREGNDLRDMMTQLEGLEIKATMDGVVAGIDAKPGMVVQPGQWFGSIFNTANMQMWVQVDDIDVLLVRTGAPVEVTVDAVPGRAFIGSVEYVGMMGKDESGITQFQVTIRVEGGPELRPGMQANAHIDAGSALGVLLVPLEAIFEEDGQAKVEILLPDGVTKVVSVELGLMNDRVAEVKSGLEEGEQVITGSTADLLPSQTIQGENLLPGSSGSGSGAGSGSGGP
jgi:HlyD family secretion protein